MVSTDALFQAVWANASSLALTLGADTRLTANQRARMIAIQSIGSTATSPSDDAELVYCLRQAMFKANKGRG